MNSEVFTDSQMSEVAISESLRWYALYTYPRHEKAVFEQLSWKAVEVFSPTFTAQSRWKDRRVQLQRPLFPSYVFARIKLNEKNRVLATPSVVRIVSFGGAPAPIADSEIEAVRLCLQRGGQLEVHPFLEIGEHVEVQSGPFEGLEGVVVRRKNGCKLLISITLIQQSVALEISADQLRPIRPNSARAQQTFQTTGHRRPTMTLRTA